jgi:arylsulfatase A-like enzyme
MPRAAAIVAVVFVALTILTGEAAAQAAPARPNIVIILADDMGYSDIGCFGGEIRTPNLDSLAAGGLRFTQFYNTGRCCPTRAALLTGVYSHQAGVGHMVDQRAYPNMPGYHGDLASNVVTIAEALRPAGYGTYMTGKWHVTPPPDKEPDQHNWPRHRGFDHFYGTIAGAGNYFDPKTLTRDDTLISPTTDADYKPQHFYYTDAISDNAVRYIRDHGSAHKLDPLFLYVAYTAAHWPLHAPEEEIAKYKGKYDAGYDAIRDARIARMRELGLLEASWKPAATARRWEDVKDKAWEARCMEVYAAQVDRMDQGIGKIVDALHEGGRLDNTVIFFLQDNGGCAEALDRAAGESGKGAAMPGPSSTYMSYGQGWANVSNTPFREYKHWVHEGGISTPLIAHWPAGIKHKGELERQPGHLIDIMATCMEVSGATLPKERNGQPTVPLEGTSLVAAFAAKPLARTQPIFFEHEGNRAVREGDWKLVAKGPKGAWELYDMKADRTESYDLAAAQPERAKEMAAKWQAWATRANVLPWPWDDADKNAGPLGPFILKAGATLNGADAPAVGGKALRITATLAKPGQDGVIVAQGGTAEGFSLYMMSNRPAFAVRVGGMLTVVESGDPVADITKELTATLSADGTITLSIGGKSVATGKAPGTLRRKPVDGLSVGRDTKGAVGPYEAPFPFDGTVKEVKLELNPR